eukprot:PhF_6_TR11171/c0_g1_i1/m.18006/K07575/K07575; PUA domain protein
MIKKFGPSYVVSTTNTQASVQRKIRAAVHAQYPMLHEEELNDILPKKEGFTAVKCSNYLTMIVVKKEPTFFQHRDGLYFPTLRLVHKYPFLLPRMQCDIGGCKYVVAGANVMCPGLTSPGGVVVDGLPVGTIVQVGIEGKAHAAALGVLLMSSDEIRAVNQGPAIESIHSLGDGLWKTTGI